MPEINLFIHVYIYTRFYAYFIYNNKYVIYGNELI